MAEVKIEGLRNDMDLRFAVAHFETLTEPRDPDCPHFRIAPDGSGRVAMCDDCRGRWRMPGESKPTGAAADKGEVFGATGIVKVTGCKGCPFHRLHPVNICWIRINGHHVRPGVDDCPLRARSFLIRML
jgi:hypothetical protein